MKKYNYNPEDYTFVKLLKEIFSCEDLSLVHDSLPDEISYTEVFDNRNDNRTWFHEEFYKKINAGWHQFDKEYIRFLKNEIRPHFNEEIIFQSNPTFRVHIPDNVAVGEGDQPFGFHRDSDPGYNHPLSEVNIFLPLTTAFGSNTIWVETETDKEDFAPMEANIGQYYIWKGTELSHGNKINRTGLSRVSFDFRVLPRSEYKPESFQSTTDRNKKFEIGHYYREI